MVAVMALQQSNRASYSLALHVGGGSEKPSRRTSLCTEALVPLR